VGGAYGAHRRPDPRIAARVAASLGDTRTVLNVGAGTGSYEPPDREALPFADGSFDAAMATFTVHQWPDLAAGLIELRRVTRGPVAILTCDPALVQRFWLGEYAPEVLATEASRYPPLDVLARGLGGTARTVPVAIPLDCSDGFDEAYYGRPERLLEPTARLACSAWSLVGDAVHERFAATLERELADGSWDHRHGRLRSQPSLDGSLVLVVSTI
jgi:SAM-dependent methyltransferase